MNHYKEAAQNTKALAFADHLAKFDIQSSEVALITAAQWKKMAEILGINPPNSAECIDKITRMLRNREELPVDVDAVFARISRSA